MSPRYRVTLTQEKQKDLEAISTKGKRAQLLDAGEYCLKWIVAKV